MNILIISANTYPTIGPRSFRTQELSEELVRKGHEVTLYTVHGDVDYTEYEKSTGVRMCNIQPCLPIIANDGKSRGGFLHRIAFHMFNRLLFYPQVEFHFIVDRIIQKEKRADLLITIAFPHSIHSGAARSKRKHPDSFPKKWIADCGDPFFLNPFINCPRYFEKYEREWCSSTDYITIPIEEGKGGYFPEYHNKIRIIPQGFRFDRTPIADYKRNEVPSFAYAGALYGKRDPRDFLIYLSTINTPFVFYLFTRTPVSDEYSKLLGDKLVNVVGKNRKECIYELSKMDFLINFTNPSVIQSPSKLIDYGIANRPIINITIPFSNEDIFQQFLHADYSNQIRINNLDDYRIENIAESFLHLANE